MRAALYYGAGDVRIAELPQPVAGSGELLVEVHAAGICGTDAGEFRDGPHWYRGPMPHVPGHEFTGVPVAAGPRASERLLGQPIVCVAVLPCGSCHSCRRGRPSACSALCVVGGQRAGGLAEFCAVPESSCVPLAPYGLTTDTGALAQPLAVAVHAWRRGRAAPGDRVLVVGAGAIGLLVTWVALHAQVELTVCDVDRVSLQRAGALGAADTVDLGNGRPVDGAYDVVLECSGTAAGLTGALAALTRGGRFVVVGHQHAPVPLDLLTLSLREIELAGTNALDPPGDVEEALRLLASRPEGWADLVPTAFPLERLVADGLRPLASGTAASAKTVFDPRIRVARRSSHRVAS